MTLSYKNITLTGASGVSPTLIGKTTMLNAVVTANSTLGTNPTSVNRVSGATTINNKLTVTGNATFSNTSGIFSLSAANVDFTGTGKTLVKTANTDVRGGSFLVTSNAAFVGTQTKLRSANVDILGPGEFLVRKANTDIRGGTLLVTSNTVIGAELNVANTFVARKGSPIQGYGGNNVTLVIGDNGKYLLMANTGGMTIKVPSNASVAFPIGAEITFVRSGGNNHMAFTNAVSGVTLLSDAGKKRVSGQYQAATLKKVAVNTWHLIGNLTT